MTFGCQRVFTTILLVVMLMAAASMTPPSAIAQTATPADSTVAAAQIAAQVQTVPLDAKPIPPTEIVAVDAPDDAGGSINIHWAASPDEKTGRVKRYKILRAVDTNGQPGEFKEVGRVPAGNTSFADGNAGTLTAFWDRVLTSTDRTSYYYEVLAVNDSVDQGRTVWEVSSESVLAGPVAAVAQWFNIKSLNVFIGVILLCVLIIVYIQLARSGKELFIRQIAGLDAVNDAVGRATEMGRKIFFIPGSSDMDNVQTLAGITILGHVAELAALYDAKLDVPVSRSLVMVACREVVKESFTKAGRPDAFKDDMVHYLTDDQFGYAAAIDGMVVREKPAAMFMLGNFYAESLILAETGNASGAIQIAGTGEPSQLPFFVAACDYTLIGEELFAASAYLSREPRQLGSLKGQDIGKGLILIMIIVGVVLETAHLFNFAQIFKVVH